MGTPLIADRRAPLAVVLTLVLLGCLGCLGCVRPDPGARIAGRGLLDLSHWDPDRDGPVALDGEWECHWGRLLAPADFQGPTPPAATAYLALPSAWNGLRLDGREVGGVGCATLRLRLLPGPKTADLALRVFNIKAAYALWLDGELLAASGRVGLTADEEIPEPSLRLPVLRVTGQPVELVLQVSNHNAWEGGVIAPLRLGPAVRLRAEQERDWAIAAFFAGSLLVMGLYHLVLYVFRKNNPSPLYFGGYCLLWLGYYVCSDASAWTVRLLFPRAGAALLDTISLVCFFVSVPVGYQFFRSLYPREFPRWLLGLALVMAAGFSILALAGRPLVLSRALPVYYLTASLLIFACLFLLDRARRHGRQGAGCILAGFSILGLVGLNDMLFDLGLIPTLPLISVGMFAFILFQSLALAQRFSRAFFAVEDLSAELEHKNVALEGEMAERTRLASEIVVVTEEERRRLSHDLHDGLCQQLTGARLRCSVLRRRTAGDETMDAAVSELSALLEGAADQAYALSRGLWPVEHDPGDPGPSLEALARRMGASSGVAIDFSRNLACAPCVNAHVVQLFRIGQEAVVNAVKHARPGRIDIVLRCDASRRLTLTVRDDGIGRRAAAPTGSGLGLRLMAHRAGMIGASLSIDDAAQGGTVVTCALACEAGAGTDGNDG